MGMKKCESCNINFVADQGQSVCNTCKQLEGDFDQNDQAEPDPLDPAAIGSQFLYMSKMYAMATEDEQEGILDTVRKLLHFTGELVCVVDAAKTKYFEDIGKL